MTHADPSAPGAGSPARADARRNRARVLGAARCAFGAVGLDAGHHEIARRAGVGVGTVYRHFPDRAALLEAVLLDVLGGLQEGAERALADADAWGAFAGFFATLAGAMRAHAGLSEQLDQRGGPRVAEARERLVETIRGLCEAARAGGPRADVGWRDVVFLAGAAGSRACSLDVGGEA